PPWCPALGGFSCGLELPTGSPHHPAQGLTYCFCPCGGFHQWDGLAESTRCQNPLPPRAPVLERWCERCHGLDCRLIAATGGTREKFIPGVKQRLRTLY